MSTIGSLTFRALDLSIGAMCYYVARPELLPRALYEFVRPVPPRASWSTSCIMSCVLSSTHQSPPHAVSLPRTLVNYSACEPQRTPPVSLTKLCSLLYTRPPPYLTPLEVQIYGA